MRREHTVHRRALNAPASPVDEPNLAEAALGRRLDVIGHDGGDEEHDDDT